MLLMNTRKLLLIFLFFIPSTILAQLNLSVHGYLNQAYAFTDGKSIFGITKDGTTDYRHLALQFRNDVDESNVFIIQLSHRREGNSPEMQFHDDVELDWAYFEHRFSENFSIKIGKIQLPLGIYSEIRDVGVLLPFYQIPYMPYGESSYMSETIDGFSFKHTLPLSDNSSIESDLFVGQWRWIEWEIIDFAGSNQLLIAESIVNKAMGLRIWYYTPFEDLSIGFTGLTGSVTDGINFSKDGLLGKQQLMAGNISIDLTKESFFFRTEHMVASLQNDKLWGYNFYAQMGFNITTYLNINSQFTYFHLNNLPEFNIDVDYYKDSALGIKYSFNPQLIFKAEYHLNESFIVQEPVNFTKSPPRVQYGIISVSTSF